jgi:hypothetical protein
MSGVQDCTKLGAHALAKIPRRDACRRFSQTLKLVRTCAGHCERRDGAAAATSQHAGLWVAGGAAAALPTSAAHAHAAPVLGRLHFRRGALLCRSFRALCLPPLCCQLRMLLLLLSLVPSCPACTSCCHACDLMVQLRGRKGGDWEQLLPAEVCSFGPGRCGHGRARARLGSHDR